MKKIILYLITLPFFCHGQTFNQHTNSYEQNSTPGKNVNEAEESNAVPGSISGISCNPNTFWVINTAGTIFEYQLNGTTITFLDTVLYASQKVSLAFADIPASGAFSPTFYSSSTNYSDMLYFDSLNWQVAYTSTSYDLVNCGGSGSHLYYMAITPANNRQIFRYNGTAFDTLYTGVGSHTVAIADLAVDLAGNVYFPFGPAPYDADSLMILDPAGNILSVSPFPVNTSGAYGSFIMNNTLYIGFTFLNPVYPSSLLPVTFSGNAAVIGTPLPFALSGPVDLESCNQALPLGINDVLTDEPDVTVANPARNICYINSGNSYIYNVVIYDVNGKEIKSFSINQKSTHINISDFANGLYILKINFKNAVVNKKLIINNN